MAFGKEMEFGFQLNISHQAATSGGRCTLIQEFSLLANTNPNPGLTLNKLEQSILYKTSSQ